MTLAHRIRLAAAGALVALVAVPVAATAAFAHDSLVSADPLAGTTVESLDSITLQFNNSPLGLDGSNLVQVIGPDGKYYETGCPTLAGPVVTAPIALGAAGEYQVEWRVVSSDGHPISEEYTFTYAPQAGAEASAGSETPQCGTAVGSPGDAANSTSASGDTADERVAETRSPVSGLGIGIGVGGFAVIAIAAAAWFILRKPRGE
ncbi:copper resistance CopC family protein [Leucobacter japonicus]|uniref:copper resistance CopC family protein n=1 Tax=Leucobacter japonicus TaxID=1461259 RepID=UPI0006A79436|nr:copper resistance CopC family protein [Leucobacter japonicus]